MVKKFLKKKTNTKYKYIKDKCVANFILKHLRKETIDFSKIKIPLSLNVVNNEEEESKSFQNHNLNKISEDQKNNNLPKFGFSFINELLDKKKEQRPYVFNSSIFKLK